MISVDSLSKAYRGSGKGVAGVSFEIERGTVTALLGLNGAGKSTVQGLMLGYVSGGGSTTFDGVSLKTLKRTTPARLGFTLQPSGIPNPMTVKAFLSARLRFVGGESGTVAESLEAVELDVKPSARISTLSVGMKQRLSITSALCSEPDFLVLDEPTNGLDMSGRKLTRSLIQKAADRGAAVLVSSHVMEDISPIVDRAVFLHHGQQIASGELSSLQATWVPPTVVVNSEDNPRLQQGLERRGLVVEPSKSPAGLKVRTSKPELVGKAAKEDMIELASLYAEEPSLESVFWSAINSVGVDGE